MYIGTLARVESPLGQSPLADSAVPWWAWLVGAAAGGGLLAWWMVR